ncbi:hypothetical protein BHE90_017577 [Fusarium euwallaceae]|uniref:Uncharacterized protein n=1 Tax=Fusarium euwallaceae TaxID=1147111 RepID=A0A430KX60_9HYPO|nr:hypothetical protein BHE90_017577 [Fusarium euwallaceae]
MAVTQQVDVGRLDVERGSGPDCHGDRDASVQQSGELLLLSLDSRCSLWDQRDRVLSTLVDAMGHLEPGWLVSFGATGEHVRSRRRWLDHLFERLGREFGLESFGLPAGQVEHTTMGESGYPRLYEGDFLDVLKHLSALYVAQRATGKDTLRVVATGGATVQLGMEDEFVYDEFLSLVVRCREAGEVESLRALLLAGYAKHVWERVMEGCSPTAESYWRDWSRLRQLWEAEMMCLGRLWT